MLSNVYCRAFITTVLVVLLLPVSSLAAICDLNCRNAAMHGMGTNSPAWRHAGHQVPSEPSQHHHHASAEAQRSAPEADVTTAVDHGRISGSHQCCYGRQRGVSGYCRTLRANESRTVVPRFANNPPVVHGQATLPVFATQAVNDAPAGEEATTRSAWHSLTLRI